MRLSEAIALGRTLIQPVPGIILSRDKTAGCAIGMAIVAGGGGGYSRAPMYPWASKESLVHCPVCCRPHATYGCYYSTIAHIFDDHVMTTGQWTLDQLIDWIRSVEPDEPVEASEFVVVDLEETVEAQ